MTTVKTNLKPQPGGPISMTGLKAEIDELKKEVADLKRRLDQHEKNTGKS